MKYVVIDYETFYSKEYSLRKMTPAEYILDPRFEVIGAGIIEHGGEPFWLDGNELQDYLDGLDKRVAVISHKSLFDACILSWRYGFVPELLIDTLGMSRALIYAFIGKASLEAVADYLNLPPKGDMLKNVVGLHADGIKSMGLWERYTSYAKHDAWLCEQIFLKLAPLFPRSEFALLDMVLRCAVVPRFDLDAHLLAQHATNIAAQKAQLLASAGLNERQQLMSTEKFAALLRGLGVEPQTKPSPTGPHVEPIYAFAKTDPFMISLLEHDDPRVQALAAARVGARSTIEQTRTEALLRISQLHWPDPTMRGKGPIPLRYSGAHTHRLSGDWKLNAQNWPTYSLSGNEKVPGMIRRAHKAPPGYKVVKRDASQIEARVAAWLVKQHDLLQAFAEGRDIYSEFGTDEIYRYPVSKATPQERFVAKSAVLGCGFGVGHMKFANDIAAKSFLQLGYAVKLELPEAHRIVTSYRQRFRNFPVTWQLLNDMIGELCHANSKLTFGPCVFERQAIVLPNGLRLFYHNLQHDGSNWVFKYGRMPKKLYGSKLFENIVQALARIITMGAALKMKRCYPDILLAHQVHDDLVYVVPEAHVPEFDAALAEAMNTPPDWANGLPLGSEGGIGPSYGEAK